MAYQVLTTFSPEGRILQVEYAYKAVKLSEVTAIGAKGKNSVVVVVQKKVQDKLIDPSTVTHMFRITDSIAVCLVGLLTDVFYMARRLGHVAAIFQRKNGFDIPVSVAAQELAAVHQLESQYSALRPTGVSAIIFGFEPSRNDFVLFRVEPSGYSAGYRAVAAGVKEIEAMSALEKKIRALDTERENEEFVVSVLQTVVGVDFEPKDIEVAAITRANPKFRILAESDVDQILKAVAEKD
jgi:20S proteasome subunit alpha 1